MDRKNLKMCLRAMYKIQNLRVKMWLQILSKLKAEDPQIQKDITAKITNARKIERQLLIEYQEYEKLENSKADSLPGYIKDDLFFIMVQSYYNLHEQEAQMLKVIKHTIEDHPLVDYLKTVRGCDDSTAAILLSEIDISKSKYVSSLYMLSGLDCGPDGKARNKTEAHLVMREYVDKDGATKTKKSITYNPFLHDKILGTIGPNLIRSKSLPYYTTYCNYKHRLEMRPDWKDRTKMHRHRAAIRYMMRTFLANLYSAWRELEGLEVHEPYEFAKLKLDHWSRERVALGRQGPVPCIISSKYI